VFFGWISILDNGEIFDKMACNKGKKNYQSLAILLMLLLMMFFQLARLLQKSET